MIKEVGDIEENSVSGSNVNIIMSVDDAVLLTDSEENLEALTRSVQ